MSEPTPPRQSARETRLLLLTLAVSVAALLLLARFRFPERPLADLSPPQSLARLTRVTAFDELSALLGDLLRQFEGAVVLVRARPPAASSFLRSAASPPTLPPARADAGPLDVLGLLVRDDLALVPLPRHARVEHVAGAALAANGIVARDDERGLTMVRVPGYSAPELSLQAQANPLDAPGYVAILEATADGPTIRAEFVSRYRTETDARWDQPVLAIGGGTRRAQPGALVFTLNGRFVGMTLPDAPDGLDVVGTGEGPQAIGDPARTLIVPAYVLMARAARLAAGESVRVVDAGVHVQALTPALARATHPSSGTAGVIVSAVEPSVAAGAGSNVAVGDVIVAVDGQPVRSPRDWRQALRSARPGATLKLSIVRFGNTLQASLALPSTDAPSPVSSSTNGQATSPSSPSTPRAPAADASPKDARPARGALGLTLRNRTGGGVDVLAVLPDSAGARAGLLAGDVIASLPGRGGTAASDAATSTPARTSTATAAAIASAYEALASGQAMLIAVERQGVAFVTAIEKA